MAVQLKFDGPDIPGLPRIQTNAKQTAMMTAAAKAGAILYINPRSKYRSIDPDATGGPQHTWSDGIVPGQKFRDTPGGTKPPQTDLPFPEIDFRTISTKGLRSDKVLFPAHSALSGGNPSFWIVTLAYVKSSSAHVGPILTFDTDGLGQGDGIYWANGNNIQLRVGGTSIITYNETALDQWHVYATAYIQGTDEMHFWRDGTLIETDTVDSAEAIGGFAYIAGTGSNYQSNSFDGKLSHTLAGVGVATDLVLQTSHEFMGEIASLTLGTPSLP